MHFFRKYRGIPVIKRPNSEYGVLWRGSFIVENSFNKDESVANCDSAKLFHRDESVPVSHLDCAAVSLFFRILSLFFCSFFWIALFFSLFFFLTYRTTGRVRGTERRRCDGGRDG
jgi:hypothetical protein